MYTRVHRHFIKLASKAKWTLYGNKVGPYWVLSTVLKVAPPVFAHVDLRGHSVGWLTTLTSLLVDSAVG